MISQQIMSNYLNITCFLNKVMYTTVVARVVDPNRNPIWSFWADFVKMTRKPVFLHILFLDLSVPETRFLSINKPNGTISRVPIEQM